MSTDTRTVLITGCSDGSLGAALAHAFHQKGLRVYATARNPDKMSGLKSAGLRCLTLDVVDDSSIKSCLHEVSKQTGGTLDILVNSAGGGHYQPFLHLDLNRARDMFETNVWGYLAVTQAFLPLLMKNASAAPDGKKTMLVNNTSISSVLRTPYHSAYSASKAAMAMFNDTQRIELQPLGIKVIDLKTGSTVSNFPTNRTNPPTLPDNSPYQPIQKEVEYVIQGHATEQYAEDQTKWAENVVSDLLQKNPPHQVWRGGRAGLIQLTNATEGVVPNVLGDKAFQRLGGLDKLEKIRIEKDQKTR